MTSPMFPSKPISFDPHIYDILDNLSRISDVASIDAEISLIDEQHSKIVDKYNDFVSSLRDHSAASQRAAKFESLISYIGLHFVVENSAMKMLSYTLCDLHVAQHAGFIAHVNGMISQVRCGSIAIEDLVLYMGHWLLGHILISDKGVMTRVVRSCTTSVNKTRKQFFGPAHSGGTAHFLVGCTGVSDAHDRLAADF